MGDLGMSPDLKIGRFRRAEFTLFTSSLNELEKEDIRCLSDLVHFNAINNPDHLFCLQTRSEGINFAYTSITFWELAKAIDQCCEWILQNVPNVAEAQLASDGTVQKCQPIALFMESDVYLFVYVVSLLTLNIPVKQT
jgi:hypothetical protein